MSDQQSPDHIIGGQLILDVSKILSDLKTVSDEVQQFKQQLSQRPSQVWIDDLGGSLANAIKRVETQARQGLLSLDQLEKKLLDIKQAFAQAGAFNGPGGITADTQMTDALLRAERQRTQVIAQENRTRMILEHQAASQKTAIEENLRRAYIDDVDQRIKQVKYLHDIQIISASDAYQRLNTIYQEDMTRFASDVDKKNQLFKQMFAYQVEAAKQAAAQIEQAMSRGTVRDSVSGNGGFSTSHMVLGMAGLEAAYSALETMLQGMKDVETGAAGIQQVFEDQIHSTQQLSDVTNQLLDISHEYGVQVTDSLDALKLYGRQYKDIQTAMTLVNQATLLSVVDSVDLQTANRGLEATMNSLGMAAKTQADAFAYSGKIVDSWSNLAHNASVSATQLIQATEASAGAAHSVGVTFDQLQALATSAIKNTGMTGQNIGNMLKSLFASIHTDAAEKALKSLDISIKQVGENGTEEFRPLFDVFLELSQKLQTTNDSQQKVLETISGGKFQWSKAASMLADYNTIVAAYAVSLNSAGAAQNYASVQMNTLGRDVQRLKDTFVQLAAQTDNNGLGSFIKSIVNGLDNLIIGLEQLPPVAGQTLLVVGGLLVGLKAVAGIMNTLDPLSKVLILAFQRLAPAMTASAAATTAEAVATEGLASAFTTLDMVSGGLLLIIGGLTAAITASAISQGEATTATEQHTQAIQNQVGAAQQQYNLAQQKQQFMQTAISQEQQLKKALDDHTLSAQQHNKVLGDMVDLYHAVGKATDDESLQQVNATNVTDHTLNAQQQAIDKLVKAKKTAYEDAVKINNQEVQDDINATNQKIKDINTVIDGLKKETLAKLGEMTAQEKAGWSWEKVTGFLDAIAGGTDDGTGQSVSGSELAQRHQQNADNIRKQAHDRALTQAQATYDGLKAKLADDQYKLASNNVDLLNIDTSGVGDVTPQGTGGGSGGSSGGGATRSNAYTNAIAQLSKRDDNALEYYKQRVDSAAYALDGFNNKLSSAEANLKVHVIDTKAASDAVKAYTDDTKALNDHANALAGENWQLRQSIDGVQKEISKVNSDFKAGRIDAQTHATAISDLNNEYDRLNQTLNSNVQAIQKDKDAIASATADLTGYIVDTLKTVYSDQEAIQSKALDSLYQPQIAALNQQRDAVDALVQSLQSQWNMQSEVNSLTDLQNQLSAVESDKRFAVVGLDGKLTYTYNTEQAAQLQKQIEEQQTKIQHDQELQRLNDQKAALDAQLKLVQDNYDKAKSALQTYWEDKLSTDSLQSEADNLILSNGMSGAFTIVQQWAGKIIDQYNQMQQAASNAAGSVLGGIGLGGGVPTTSSGAVHPVTSGSSKTAPNGEKYTIWSDVTRQYYYGNDWQSVEKAAQGFWKSGHWIPYKPASLDTGGYIPHGKQGFAMLHENEIVVNSPLVDKLKNLTVTVPKIDIAHMAKPVQNISVKMGDWHFPSVRTGEDAHQVLGRFLESVQKVR